MTQEMTTNALAGWFGSNRLLAETVGKMLGKCEHVVIPFAGGCCELKYINARTIIVNDLHRHAINCAQIIADVDKVNILAARLEAKLFHPDELKTAQEYCKCVESEGGLFRPDPASVDEIEWAEAFFVACWMNRGGSAGTDSEFNGGISLRYDAGGGDSNVRYRSAISSLQAWHKILCGRCNFTCEDFREVLGKTKDKPGHAVYADSPWPDAGDSYKHKFSMKDQRDLAARLGEFKHTRVVVRFGEHPLIRELYSEPQWTWHLQTSRCQHNAEVAEALIVNEVSK